MPGQSPARLVVDLHHVPLVKAIFRYVELAVVLSSECRLLGVVLLVEDAGEKVVLELCDKILQPA